MDDIVKRGKTKRILDILADYFSVYTDEELVEKLGYTRTSITKWRFYNQVPKKILVEYRDILNKNLLVVNDGKPDVGYNIKDAVYYTPLEIAEKLKIPAFFLPGRKISWQMELQNFKEKIYSLGGLSPGSRHWEGLAAHIMLAAKPYYWQQ